MLVNNVNNLISLIFFPRRYHIVYFMTGLWIYPILARLNWFGRMILMAVSGLVAYGSFFAGLYGNNLVWKNKVQVSKLAK